VPEHCWAWASKRWLLDDGKTWHAFQQNLAVAPVTDIKVVRSDLAISTMGRSFWVLDNVTTLRQDDFLNTGDSALVFQPMDTIRYRNVYTGKSSNGVPDYPPPAVVIDYYIAPDNDGAVTLDILDADGTVVNSYTGSAQQPDEDEVATDMALSQAKVITDDTLANTPGMHRFRWNMQHAGAWHEDQEKAYRDGPLAKLGSYTVRLTVGDEVSEQEFKLVTDPRVLQQGTTIADINAQVDMQLEIVAMLSEARELEKRLSDEKDALEKKGDARTSIENARLEKVADLLPQIKTADYAYPQPMLTNQISYLFEMLNNADQAPGQEAEQRLQELRGQLRALVTAAAD
jgi:polyhydroxyalkanoate synthesis regulator phasin